MPTMAAVSSRAISVYVTAVAGCALGVVALAAKAGSGSHPVADLIFGGVAGYLFLAAGVAAAARRPGNRCGLLIVGVGVGFFAEDLQLSTNALLYSLGLPLIHAAAAFVAHLVLAYPLGVLTNWFERVLAVAAYFFAIGVTSVRALFLHPPSHLLVKPPNLLLVQDNPAMVSLLGQTTDLGGAVVAAGVLGVLVHRWVKASWPARWVLAPVFGTGLVGGLATAIGGVFGYSSRFADVGLVAYKVAFCLLPLGILAGVLRVRIGPTRMDGLLTQLGLHRLGSPQAVQQVLAKGLGDPSLRIGYWQPESGSYVDRDGHSLEVGRQAATPIAFEGRPLAVLVHDPALREDQRRLDAVAAAAAMALERERLAAEVLAQVQASRARLVAATDAERRRIGRDLHDGAQQNLVLAALFLNDATTRLDGTADAGVADSLSKSAQAIDRATNDLRELAQGLHPVVLATFGLGPALESLGRDMPIPVEVAGPPLPRLPETIESTAYLAAKEALTNTLKHAGATRAWIRTRYDGKALEVEVRDNGSGGARLGSGTGLLGLQDRVLALDGTMMVHSPAGGGTAVTVTLPSHQAITQA